MNLPMQLIWFRQALRIHDQTALWHATQAGQTVAVVMLSPGQWLLHDDAPIKIDFYLRQLQQLKQQLDALNIPLLIETVPLWKDIPDSMLKLCQQFKIEKLHANIEAGVNEQQRDAQVAASLHQHQIATEFYLDRTLFPLGNIRNQSNAPYQVFGAFKKRCYEHLSLSLPSYLPAPEAQPAINTFEFNVSNFSTSIPCVQALYPDFIAPKSIWSVGEAHAFALLDDFLDEHVRHYPTERDYPHLQGTSQLSAYLNLGIISIRQCVNALFREQHGQLDFEHAGQQIWLDELLWREFYQHILYDFPRVSKHLPFRLNTQKVAWRSLADPIVADDFQAWKQGQTGIPIVDAGMRQMLATGWMHNRIRMIVAMFLSKNLLIDWRLGEQWFMQHLIDGDLAANNGGWQWCASTGTDSVPYFRVFNPVSQSQKFDANGDYIRTWVPELAGLDAKSIHAPYAKNPNLNLNYAKPVVDLKMSRIRAIEAFKQI